MPARSLAAALFALALLLPRAASAVPIGGACKDDTQCDAGSICNDQVCSALPKGRRIFPFYWSQPGDVGYQHVPIALYFSTWDRERKTQVQVPFFVHLKNYKEQRDTYAIPPLLISWSTTPTEKTFRLYPLFFYGKYTGDDAGSQAALLPVFWWTSRYQHQQLILPLIGSGYSRDEKEDTEFLMAGFLAYFYRHQTTSYKVVLPLFYNKSTPDESTTIAPLAYFHNDARRAFGMVFPLVWRIADHEKGTDHLLLLPLFDYDSERFGRRKRLFSLVAAWEKDQDAGLEQLALFFPPYFHRRDPLRDVDVAPPFFARWKVHEDDSSGFLAGPIYHSSDPEGSTTAVFPLYWGFQDRRSGAGTHLVLPIGGWHHGPGLFGLVIGPVFGWRNTNAPGSYGGGVAPLVIFHREGPRHQELVLPVFARWGDDSTHTTTTAVAGAYYRSTPDGWDAGLMPLLHFGAHKNRNHVYVAPIFWHRHTPERDLDVVGPAYFSRGQNGWSAGIVPLFFAGHDLTTGREHQLVLPPLFVRTVDRKNEQEHMLVGIFYHRRDHAETSDVLFPLLYLRRSPVSSTLLMPIAYWHKDARLGQETIWAGPWFQHTDDRSHARTFVLFPLGVIHDGPDLHVRVQFPFFWYLREGQETDLAVFPFYWRVRSPERQLDAVFPLFLHMRSAAATTTVVGPAWYRARADGGRSFGIVPLVAYYQSMHDGKAHAWAAAPGVWWAKNDTTGSRDLVVGSFFHFTRGDGYTAGLFPLAFAWRRGTGNAVIAPFFYHGHDSATDSSVTVVASAYWGHHGPKSYFGVAPLLFHTNNGEGTQGTAFFPFFYFQKRPVGSTLITPIAGFSKSPGGLRVYVGPFYWRSDEQATSVALFPLIYFNRDKHTGARTHMVLPLFFDTRSEDGHELQIYTPLLWRYRTVERSIVVGVPLYFDVNSFGESRTTVVLPLFSRTEDRVENQTTYVFPALLTWARVRRSGDAGTDVVVFPLIWRFGGKDSTTVVFPLWWDFKRGENRTTVLFPIGARWTRPDNEYTLVLNSYFRKGRGPREGEWYFDLVPIVNFGRPRKKDLEWNVLEGLVGYARQGLNRTLRIFWLIELKLSPAPAQGVSFFGATPTSARTEF